MSSVAESKSTLSLEPLRQNQWNVIYGLFWGALALLLLAVWLNLKYWETIPWISWAVGLLFLAALGAGVWQTLQMRSLSREKPEVQQDRLIQARKGRAPILFALSGALLLLMVILLMQFPDNRLAAFPEVSSGILLALIGGLSGLLLSAGPERRFHQQQFLEMLVRNRRPVLLTCLVLGGALFLLGLYLSYTNRVDLWGVFPVAGGAMLLGLIFLGIGLWELLATSRELNVSNMRILVLVAGGAAGLVITLMTALQGWQWRADVMGGISVWQGPQAWRLWLTTWLALLGLGLMFGSLYLAQADIRFNITLRRLLYGYNAVFTGLLVLAALVVLNVVVYASFPYTFNWTESQGFYSLSEKSKNILRKLDQQKTPVTIYMVMSSRSGNYTDTKYLLENCQAYTNLLEVREVSPDQHPREYKDLQDRFPTLKDAQQSVHGTAGRGLLIAYNYSHNNPPPAKERVPNAFISASDLSDEPPPMMHTDQPQRRVEFRGEDLVMTELRFLMGGEQKPAVYFTQGYGELDVKNKMGTKGGAGLLAEKLEGANFEVRQLFLGPADPEQAGEGTVFSQKNPDDPHKIPTDAKTLVIAWPKETYSKGILDALEEYMKAGGKMIIMSPAVDGKYVPRKTGLEDLLKKFAVEMGNNVIIHDSDRLAFFPYSASLVEAAPKSNNEIAQFFTKEIFIFDAARQVKAGASVGGYTAEEIFIVPKKPQEFIWVESDMKVLDRLSQYVENIRAKGELWKRTSTEPLPVAVAVKDRDNKPRLLVYGDGQMASNNPLGRPLGLPYHELILSSVEWLGERPENIGIEPKKTNFYTLPPPQQVSRQRMILLPLGLMSLGLIGIGMGVWVVRRP